MEIIIGAVIFYESDMKSKKCQLIIDFGALNQLQINVFIIPFSLS